MLLVRMYNSFLHSVFTVFVGLVNKPASAVPKAYACMQKPYELYNAVSECWYVIYCDTVCCCIVACLPAV